MAEGRRRDTFPESDGLSRITDAVIIPTAEILALQRLGYVRAD